MIPVLAITGCSRGNNGDKTSKAATRYIERAESYRQQSQYRAAIIEARNAVSAAPHDTESIVELASLYNDLHQSKQALSTLEPLTDSNDESVVKAYADALLDERKFRSALEYLNKHSSTNADIQLRVAEAQAGLGLTSEAEATFLALGKTSQADAASLQLARLYLDQGNNIGAENILQKLLQKNPNEVDALVLSAKQSEMHNDLPAAEALLSRALLNLPQADIITPQKTIVLQRLIPILTKLGRTNESLVYAKVLADANPKGAALQSKFTQGLKAFKAGDLDEAEKLLSDVYEQTHDDSAGIVLGMIKYNQKDYTAAAAYLGKSADPEVAPTAALEALANAEMRLGQPGRLLELIGPQDRDNIKDPELKALIGIAQVQSGNAKAGEKTLADAVNSAPQNDAVRATLARYYLIEHQATKAIETLKAGLKQKSSSPLQRLLIEAYIANHQAESALEEAHKLAATSPDSAVNYYVLGHTALIAKQYALSDSALQKALSLQPGYAPALLDSAQLQLIHKQPQNAVETYKRLIANNADDTMALKGFITALEMQGAKASSNDIEKDVLQLTKSDNAHAVLAEYYLRNQRQADAARLLSQISIGPGNSYPSQVKQLYALSKASDLLKSKKYDLANQAALEGLRLNPRNPNLLALVSRIEIASGATEEAKKIIEQLAQVAPGSPALLDLRASLAATTGDMAEAVRQYRALWNTLKSDQTGNKLYQALAKTAPSEATQFLTEWQTALPNSDSPLLLRAVQYERDGELQQAQNYYEAAIHHNDKNALALNNLAMLYFKNHDKRATSLAKRAYDLQPKNPAILDTYGWLLVQSGQAAKGAPLLEEAAALAPSVEAIKTHLAEAKEIH